MKTLLLTLEFPPFKGGIANYYGNLANYWPINEKLIVIDNSRGELMPDRRFMSWRAAFGTLRRRMAKNDIDYVLVGHVLPLGTVTWFLSFFRSFRYAVILHGLDLSAATMMPRKRFLTRLILKRADRIIAANSYVAEKAVALNSSFKEKIRVINPGVPAGTPNINAIYLNDLKNKYELNGKTVLLSLGRLVRRKGVDQVISALTQIPESVLDNLVYFIVGAGDEEDYLRSLVTSKLRGKVVFLGEVSELDKWSWLKLCDIFIMPARDIKGDFEGFGIVYLEANLNSKAVIAGKAGGVKDAVVDGYNGILVDPEDIFSIKEAIIKLATDKALCDTLGEQGRQRALADFNWEKQVLKIVSLIKSGK